MNRRRVLGIGYTGLALGLAGCLTGQDDPNGPSETNDDEDADDWDPDITVPEPELEPGGETTVTVEATDAAGFHTPELPNTTAITVEYESSEDAPTPSRRVETLPGYLYWDGREDIAVDVHVAAEEDAEPGEYPFAVTVFDRDSQDREGVTADSRITVVEASE